MINRVENWEKVEPNYGEAKKLKAGGYILEILAVAMEKSKNGNDMIVINFDIAEGEDRGFYMKKYKDAPRTDGKEPKWQGKYYIVLNVEGYEARLKAFTTSIEESNQGYVWNWDEQSLKGKKFGGIFREEEYVSNNEIRTSTKLWQPRSVKTIRDNDFQIPKLKELGDDEKERVLESQNNFNPITDDDLPF